MKEGNGQGDFFDEDGRLRDGRKEQGKAIYNARQGFIPAMDLVHGIDEPVKLRYPGKTSKVSCYRGIRIKEEYTKLPETPATNVPAITSLGKTRGSTNGQEAAATTQSAPIWEPEDV